MSESNRNIPEDKQTEISEPISPFSGLAAAKLVSHINY